MKVKASHFHHICTNNESESDHLSMCSKITSVIDINSDRQVEGWRTKVPSPFTQHLLQAKDKV